LGRGTNVIPGSLGYRGLIILNRIQDITFDSSASRVVVGSGYSLSKLILDAASCGMGGMEALFGIPGSVGGALVVNAGTHGVEFGSFVRSVSVLNSDGIIESKKPSWFEFRYRGSKLKHSKSKHPCVIANLVIQLQKKKNEDIVSSIAEYNKFRETKQPIGEMTSGSIFKNPSCSDTATNVKEKSAGYLLEQSGAKSLTVDGAKVSKKHANWIINSGKADAKSVRILADKMKEAVFQKFSVMLEEEVEYFGQWDN
jgi:UDP-N-acetylmuramate dehydrogenase